MTSRGFLSEVDNASEKLSAEEGERGEKDSKI